MCSCKWLLFFISVSIFWCPTRLHSRSPPLSYIYVNGLTDLPFSPLTRLILYADDIFIFKPISSSAIQFLLGFPHTFFKSILPKYKYIFFSHKSFSYFDSFSKLTISQSPIERVSSFRYLGIILSSSLLWSPHISFVCNKSRKILGLLFRHFSPHSSPSTRIRLYISLVRPILEYGSIIWNPSSPSLSHSLNSVQLFALKIASKFHSSLIPIILSEFNVPSLASRRQKAKLIFLFKLITTSFIFHLKTSILPCPSLLTLSALFTQTTLFVHLLENLLFIIPTFLLPFVIGTFFLPHLKKLTLSLFISLLSKL